MADYKLYDRRYELILNDGEEEITIEGGEIDKKWIGFDISGKVTKTADTVPNELELQITNLNPDHRAWLSRRNIAVTLKAGYRESYGQIFKGNIESVPGHEHQGTNWVSKIYAKDGGAALRDLHYSKSFKAGTPLETVINDVLKKLTSLPSGLKAEFQKINQLAQGKIDLQSFKPKKAKPKEAKTTAAQKTIPDTKVQQQTYLDKKRNSRETAEASKLKRSEVLRGAAIAKLRSLCRRAGLVCVLTDLTISIYPKGMALIEEQIVLDQSSGLIGSPEKTDDGYKIRSLLRHEFNAGLLITVNSLYASGVYEIKRVEHQPSIPGEWVSDLYCVEFKE